MKGEAFKLKLEYRHSDYVAILIINHHQIRNRNAGFPFLVVAMQMYTTTHIHLKGRGPVRML